MGIYDPEYSGSADSVVSGGYGDSLLAGDAAVGDGVSGPHEASGGVGADDPVVAPVGVGVDADYLAGVVHCASAAPDDN